MFRVRSALDSHHHLHRAQATADDRLEYSDLGDCCADLPEFGFICGEHSQPHTCTCILVVRW